MVQPTLKPTDYSQMLERRHHDPPVLWFSVSLGSLLIHLLAFGIVRLSLMGDSENLPSKKTIVPVDVVAVAPTTTSPTQITQKPSAVSTKNPSAVNPPTKSTVNSSQNPSTTPIGKQPTKRSPTSSQNKLPAPIQKPVVKVSPSPKDRKSPTDNSSSNQQPKPQPSSKPTSSPSPSPKPTSSPNPSPKPTPSPSPSPKPTPSPTTGTPTGGLISTGQPQDRTDNRQPILHPGDPTYGDELATLLEGNQHLSGEELKQLGITLDRVLELRVGVLIDTDGRATVLPKPTKVVRGTISQDKAVALAKKIIQQWKFKPTKMAGQYVEREYYLPLTISPEKK